VRDYAGLQRREGPPRLPQAGLLKLGGLLVLRRREGSGRFYLEHAVHDLLLEVLADVAVPFIILHPVGGLRLQSLELAGFGKSALRRELHNLRSDLSLRFVQ
jgi:hypothetical protein